MAYQAHREKKYTETLELVNENGQVEHTLTVELSAGELVEKLSKKYVDLLHAQKAAKQVSVELNAKEEVQEAYISLGKAVVDIIESVFGPEDTKTIIDFYGKNYADMTREIIPFITEVVLPQVRQIEQAKKKQILSKYNRKTRRRMEKMGWKS